MDHGWPSCRDPWSSFISVFSQIVLFKFLNGLALLYLSDLLRLRTPARCLRSSNQKLFFVPRSWLKKNGDRVFAIAGPNRGTAFQSLLEQL